MLTLQNSELLPKNQIFEQMAPTSAKESEHRTDQQPDDVHHGPLLSQFACEWQRSKLLKSKADGVLANHTPKYAKDMQSRGSLSGLAKKGGEMTDTDF